MAKVSQFPDLAPLEVLQRLVADHGDAFRFSLSKKGRIWLTLTHWDNEKYNTSAELPSFAEPSAFMDALSVVCVAHWLKCFSGGPHADTWTGVDGTRDLVPSCRAQCRAIMAGGTVDPPDVEPGDETEAVPNET